MSQPSGSGAPVAPVLVGFGVAAAPAAPGCHSTMRTFVPPPSLLNSNLARCVVAASGSVSLSVAPTVGDVGSRSCWRWSCCCFCCPCIAGREAPEEGSILASKQAQRTAIHTTATEHEWGAGRGKRGTDSEKKDTRPAQERWRGHTRAGLCRGKWD